MTSPRNRRLFPLYLTPLERFFLADDRPGHPMTFRVHLRVSGVVDRERFESAVRAALDRHPLLDAVVCDVKRGRPCWTNFEGSQRRVTWLSADSHVPLGDAEYVDLKAHPGLHIWVVPTRDEAWIVLQFHHSAADGTGAYRFIGDMLALYGQSFADGDDGPTLEPFEPGNLRRRVDLQVELWPTRRFAAMTGRTLLQLGRLLRGRPAPLTDGDAARRNGAALEMVTAYCNADEHRELRNVAIAHSATLNDLLIAALFRTLADRAKAGSSSARRSNVRVMMPVDLRKAEDMRMPAASLTSYAFITRAPDQCRDAETLLREMSRATSDIKAANAAVVFSDSVAIGLSFGPSMSWVVRAPVALASAVLSNAGDPSRRFTAKLPRRGGLIVAGNLVLEEITGVPPLRPHTNLAISASAYGKRLAISLRCHGSAFDAAGSRALLDDYMRALAAYHGSPAPPVSKISEISELSRSTSANHDARSTGAAV